MLEAHDCARNPEKKEAVRCTFESTEGLPSVVTFIKYSSWYELMLNVTLYSFQSENLKRGSIILLKPGMQYEVTFANRDPPDFK